MKNREVRDRISHFGESDFFNNIDEECRMLLNWVCKGKNGTVTFCR